MNVVLPKGQWVDLYAATGISLGTQLAVLNITPNDVRLASTTSEPTSSDDHVPLLFRSFAATNASDSLGAWALCSGGGAIDIEIANSATGWSISSGESGAVGSSAPKPIEVTILIGQTFSNTIVLPNKSDFGVGIEIPASGSTVGTLTVKAAGKDTGSTLPNYTGLTPIPYSLATTQPFVKHLNGIQVPVFSWEMWSFGAFQFQSDIPVTGSDLVFDLLHS